MLDISEDRIGSGTSEQKQLPNNAAVFTLDEPHHAALAEIDNAGFRWVTLLLSSPSSLTVPSSWFHVRTCIIAGVGFLIDVYDIFAISMYRGQHARLCLCQRGYPTSIWVSRMSPIDTVGQL